MILNFLVRNVSRKGIGFNIKSTIQTKHLQTLPTSVLFKHVEKKPRINGINKFHVSSPKNALPHTLVFLMRRITVLSAFFIRKWWRKLSPEEKEKILNNIKSKSSKIAAAGVFGMICLYIFYIMHVVEDPITKRRKFIIFKQQQINQISECEYLKQIDNFKADVVPLFHPIYKRVNRVLKNLLISNGNINEIQNKIWTVTVIDRPEIINACALGHGKIIVFSGVLNVCTNDDQLAYLLGHEIAHSVLSHANESLSKICLVEFFLLFPILILWIILPSTLAIFSQFMSSTLADILIHLPFSRAIEKEADFVGLLLAARSCYDVREASKFWKKMKIINSAESVEWLSTHSSIESRQLDLQEFLPEALHIRKLNNCPPLPFRLTYW